MRRRIRAYVWIEGVATLVVVVGIAFWLGMALDWMFEPSPTLRKCGGLVIGIAAIFVLYRYLLRRVFVPITDTSAALLLERRFPQLQDHLITAVDVSRSSQAAADYHPQLIAATTQAADRAIANVRVPELFNRGPLLRAVVAAALLVVSIATFALISRDAFGFWLQRIALSEEPWPRRVQLEVVGFPAIQAASAHTSSLKMTTWSCSFTPAPKDSKRPTKSKSASASPMAAAAEIRSPASATRRRTRATSSSFATNSSTSLATWISTSSAATIACETCT